MNLRFRIATLLIVVVAAAVCLAVYIRLHPSKVRVVLGEIERLSEENSRLDLDLVAVTYDPRGQHTKFICHIEDNYFLQTLVDLEPDNNHNNLYSAAVIKRVSQGSWKYVFPIYIDGTVMRKFDGDVGDPFAYQHITSGKGPNCVCPDCQSLHQ